MTIDLTELAKFIENDAGALAGEAAYQWLASTWFGAWLRLPIISTLAKAAIAKLFEVGFKAGVMQAFFLNTAIRKAGQAKDYVTATRAMKTPAADIEDAKKKEAFRMKAFTELVMVTR